MEIIQRQTDRQTDRETDKQAETETEKDRDRHTDTKQIPLINGSMENHGEPFHFPFFCIEKGIFGLVV